MMRKYGKLFLTILTLCLALVLAFTVAGCGGETGWSVFTSAVLFFSAVVYSLFLRTVASRSRDLG